MFHCRSILICRHSCSDLRCWCNLHFRDRHSPQCIHWYHHRRFHFHYIRWSRHNGNFHHYWSRWHWHHSCSNHWKSIRWYQDRWHHFHCIHHCKRTQSGHHGLYRWHWHGSYVLQWCIHWYLSMWLPRLCSPSCNYMWSCRLYQCRLHLRGSCVHLGCCIRRYLQREHKKACYFTS